MDIDCWHDIQQVYHSQLTLGEKYTLLYNMMHRLCVWILADDAATYTDFFSRLQAVCRLTGYPLHGIDRFRWRARRIRQGEQAATEAEFAADFDEFIKAYARFTDTFIPNDLPAPATAGQPARQAGRRTPGSKWQKSVRLVVAKMDGSNIYAWSRDMPHDGWWRVDCTANEQTSGAIGLMSIGMQLNAANCIIDEAEGIITPEIIVLLPDYLIDVSALCSCLKPYGASPLNYILGKLRSDTATHYTMLGLVAGQFLDDCVNNPEATYTDSMRHAFSQNLIALTTTEGIDAGFFDECKRQFDNIRHTLSNMPHSHEAQLEPSFFCETLGLQGRFDYLSLDMTSLIELKSGKWDTFRQRARRKHLMQMILYKEIMHYNLGLRRLDVAGYLLYSKYPMLLEQRTAPGMVLEMMHLRNQIVATEQDIAAGNIRRHLQGLAAADLNLNGSNSKLWTDYNLPELKQLLRPLQEADTLTADYFYTFFTFVSREQYLAHVGDSRIDSSRGMASLWNNDLKSKQENGDILFVKLETLKPHLTFSMAESAAMTPGSPSFRTGDAVILYVNNTPADTPTTQQVIRCSIENIEAATITLEERTPCHNPHIFNRENHFAIEHDYVDSNMRPLFAGLYSMLCVAAPRRELLLCRRTPQVDTAVKLVGNYPNPQINDIVLRAKQARDYFLLVGPPGTGKTSVALRAMVDECLLSGRTLLLMAYTNRAVDEICQVLESMECNYLRIGRALSCDPQYRKRLIENIVGNHARRQSVMQLTSDTPVFVGTVSSITSNISLLRLKQFDVTIIDEASQILEPQLLSLLCNEHDGHPSIRKFIMIGDHRQLPAVVVQDEQISAVANQGLNAIGLTNCRNSLFERLYSQAPAEVKGQLTHQGRMHPSIADFPSRMFYNDSLLPVGLKHQTTTLPYTRFTPEQRIVATSRIAFFDVPAPPITQRQVKMNRGEAEKIGEIVSTLRSLATYNNLAFCASEQIGIIVPYRRQIALVRESLHHAGITDADKVIIDTVERYQGSQKDIIIYGTTITQTYELDILSNIVMQDGTPIDRKLNVALTRARKQLFIVGNAALLNQNAIYRELIATAGGPFS